MADSCCNNQDQKPKVTLQIGKLIGCARETKKGKEYVSFLGVPYAEPPVGKSFLEARSTLVMLIAYPLRILFLLFKGHLRFRRPVPVRPWEEALDASRKKFPKPMQLNTLIG